jgi:hypothetical protein
MSIFLLPTLYVWMAGVERCPARAGFGIPGGNLVWAPRRDLLVSTLAARCRGFPRVPPNDSSHLFRTSNEEPTESASLLLRW